MVSDLHFLYIINTSNSVVTILKIHRMHRSHRGYTLAEDLDEMNIEIMRNTLYKAYLDDFAAFCRKLGGTTGAVMGDLLSFEVRVSMFMPAYMGTAQATILL